MKKTAIQERLFALQDLAYRDFQAKLMPTVDKARVIGVRTPALRQYARELAGTPEAAAFLAKLPHDYYEENNLHGFLIERIKGYEETVAALDAFLPHVDNWATCDLMRPRAFKKRPAALYPAQIDSWLASPHPYTVRFGLGMLLWLYLDEGFEPEMLARAAGIRSDEYYVNMMVAWYFATALAKQPEAALPYLKNHRLPRWTHNKAIQKAVESRRISAERKTYLKALRR
ncbi:MAG: DNA alkylation repair protein [Christensenellales bacterium]|jgi:3-methyladenine DNA glycosylase AlkD